MSKAEEYLRAKYGAHRGHPRWRDFEEMFNAGFNSCKSSIEDSIPKGQVIWRDLCVGEIIAVGDRAIYTTVDMIEEGDNGIGEEITEDMEVLIQRKVVLPPNEGSV